MMDKKEWECKICTFLNSITSPICSACSSVPNWNCPSCTFENKGNDYFCEMCGNYNNDNTSSDFNNKRSRFNRLSRLSDYNIPAIESNTLDSNMIDSNTIDSNTIESNTIDSNTNSNTIDSNTNSNTKDSNMIESNSNIFTITKNNKVEFIDLVNDSGNEEVQEIQYDDNIDSKNCFHNNNDENFVYSNNIISDNIKYPSNDNNIIINDDNYKSKKRKKLLSNDNNDLNDKNNTIKSIEIQVFIDKNKNSFDVHTINDISSVLKNASINNVFLINLPIPFSVTFGPKYSNNNIVTNNNDKLQLFPLVVIQVQITFILDLLTNKGSKQYIDTVNTSYPDFDIVLLIVDTKPSIDNVVKKNITAALLFYYFTYRGKIRFRFIKKKDEFYNYIISVCHNLLVYLLKPHRELEVARSNEKIKNTKYKSINSDFFNFLLKIPNVSQNVALAITSKYPTLNTLITAYNCLVRNDNYEGAKYLLSNTVTNNNKYINRPLSASVFKILYLHHEKGDLLKNIICNLIN